MVRAVWWHAKINVINGWLLEPAPKHDYTWRAAIHELRHLHEWSMVRRGIRLHLECCLICRWCCLCSTFPCSKILGRHGVACIAVSTGVVVFNAMGVILRISLRTVWPRIPVTDMGSRALRFSVCLMASGMKYQYTHSPESTQHSHESPNSLYQERIKVGDMHSDHHMSNGKGAQSVALF